MTTLNIIIIKKFVRNERSNDFQYYKFNHFNYYIFNLEWFLTLKMKIYDI